MYLPPHFAETDPAAIRGLVEAFPLAVIVAVTADGPIANHIPLLMPDDAHLVGHIALANDLHRLVPDGAEVLAIFRGGDAYVSPNWYPSKAEHHRHVPTWNYEVVHVRGRILFQHDEKAKTAAVGRLTRALEGRTNGEAGWRMADAPRDYMATMLANIVAFRIDVDVVTGKSKLSQNRDARDFENVVRTLGARGEVRVAGAMDRVGRNR